MPAARTSSTARPCTSRRTAARPGSARSRSEQVGLPEESGLKVEKLWHLRPGHPDRPGELWLGGAPGVLFRSQDSGRRSSVYVDGVDAREHDGVETRLEDGQTVLVLQAVAGG